MRPLLCCLTLLALAGCGPSKTELADLALEDAVLEVKEHRAARVTDWGWPAAAHAVGKRGTLPAAFQAEVAALKADHERVERRLGSKDYDGYISLVRVSPRRWAAWEPLVEAGGTDFEAEVDRFRAEVEGLEKRMKAGEITAADLERQAEAKLMPVWRAAMHRVDADAKTVAAVAP